MSRIDGPYRTLFPRTLFVTEVWCDYGDVLVIRNMLET